MSRKSIPEKVREYAIEWFKEYTDGDRPGDLQATVNEYLDKLLVKMLDRFIGIKREWDRIELLEGKEGEETPAQTLMNLYGKKAMEQLMEIIPEASIKLTAKEKRKLERSFRESFLSTLDERVQEIAAEKAHAITTREIDDILSDDEILHIVRNKLGEKMDEDLLDG